MMPSLCIARSSNVPKSICFTPVAAWCIWPEKEVLRRNFDGASSAWCWCCCTCCWRVVFLYAPKGAKAFKLGTDLRWCCGGIPPHGHRVAGPCWPGGQVTGAWWALVLQFWYVLGLFNMKLVWRWGKLWCAVMALLAAGCWCAPVIPTWLTGNPPLWLSTVFAEAGNCWKLTVPLMGWYPW